MSRSRKTRSFVWSYFNKLVDEDGERKAECRICFNLYRYCSTSHNLVTHLRHKHGDVLEKSDSAANNVIYECFTKEDGKVECKLCESIFSEGDLKSLVNHLKNEHKDAHDVYVESLLDQGDDDKFTIQLIEDNSNDSTSTLWSYFKEVSETQLRCLLCHVIIPHSGDDVRRHMREGHTKLHAEATDNEDDNEQAEDNEVFSEVIYLDGNDQPQETRRKRRKSISFNRVDTHKQSKKLRMKILEQNRDSTSSDEVLAAPRASSSDILVKNSKNQNGGGDELEKFGVYITSLLRTVPNDISIKLQMDIVNLIMTEKLKSSLQEKQVVPDHVPVTLQIVGTAPGADDLPGTATASDNNSGLCDPVTSPVPSTTQY